ncbi:hypothetical protein [Lewinella sp. IMCC34191]|uniref:hypothetical protein n=1 Tax=Lewinella sp. IMCC34191 TaxID=2259172 RepID=UPI001300724E|nr:hypothetical protein [Lewinella sp. IMCC34191]
MNLPIPDTRRCSLAVLFILGLLFGSSEGKACTIVSAVGADGQVWNMNNEDGPLDVATFLRVFPRSDSSLYGYYTLAYLSPEEAAGGGIQGGMNEAGLTFDFNAIRNIDFTMGDRVPFPGGNGAIMPYLLGNLSTVEEVVAFFETYWFDGGFTSAQMHVADRSGTFAIISASGVIVAEEGEPLVSTNFDICGKEDGAFCWRYPLATKLLSDGPIDREKMLTIAQRTSVDGRGHTLYSNVQNLTTGEVWFTTRESGRKFFSVRLDELLARGAGAYPLNDLERLSHGSPAVIPAPPPSFTVVALDTTEAADLAGTYQNDFIGTFEVDAYAGGIALTFANGYRVELAPSADNRFYLPGEALEVTFADGENGLALSLYQDGFWSATAIKLTD